MKKEKKPINKNLFKHGSYAVVLTAVVITAVIAFNTIFALLAERVNMNIDLSSAKDNSLTVDNIEFIKSIDKEVTITVCSTRDDYVGGYMNYYAQNYFMTTDATGQYYEQTLKLLDLYSVYSDKITIKYVDPQEPEFAEIYSKYSSANIIYGDMIVECAHIINGQEKVITSIVSYKDIYYSYDSSGMASYGYDYYYVEGNNFETAMTGALYKVTSEETYKVGYVTTHCDLSYATDLMSTLNMNNFEAVEIDSVLISEIDEDIDILVIMAPKQDFLSEELEVINNWLIGDGSRGKGMLFFPSVYSPELPKLYGFMQEWGVSYDDGIVFETNAEHYYSGDPTQIFSLPAETEEEEIASIVENTSLFISKLNVPMKPTFVHNGGNRYTDVLSQSVDESAVIAPKDVELTWEVPNTYVKSSFATSILAQDTSYIDGVKKTSYIAAFSSADFVDSEFVTDSSISNMNLVLNAAKLMIGQEKNPIEFTMKYLETEDFSATVTEGASKTIKTIFMIVLPIAVLACGITVFIRRRLR